MSINRSAEFIVLWKSRQREEWEGDRLKEGASALRRQAAAKSGRRVRLPGSGTTMLVEVPAETAEDLEAAAQQLEEESRRKREFCSEIEAELARVAAALTPDQRKEAEKVLKQWESEQGAEEKLSG